MKKESMRKAKGRENSSWDFNSRRRECRSTIRDFQQRVRTKYEFLSFQTTSPLGKPGIRKLSHRSVVTFSQRGRSATAHVDSGHITRTTCMIITRAKSIIPRLYHGFLTRLCCSCQKRPPSFAGVPAASVWPCNLKPGALRP